MLIVVELDDPPLEHGQALQRGGDLLGDVACLDRRTNHRAAVPPNVVVGPMAGVDRDLEDAARVDGAAEGQVFRLVTVPLAGPTLAAGIVMSWARALGEFGATIMFAGSLQGVTQTLSLAIYAQFDLNLDLALALGALLIAISAGILLAAKLLPAWTRSLSTSLSPSARSG